jgi:hypothetical protein
MAMINKEHKDRLFCFLFGSESNKEWTLSLYNAVNGTDHRDADDILFTTMDDAIYMGMKNDVSFNLFHVMNIYEQQSTYNPNMGVRQLMYAGKLYDKYIHRNKLNVYGKRIVKLPIPKLVVFYNGTEGKEDRILKLSDAFETKGQAVESDIEVKVRMININYGQNRKLLGACRPLEEYAWLVKHIRENHEDMDIENAVDKAIDEMPADYVIRPFLIGNRAEVKGMCITEYNEAETLQMIREEGREEGRKEGREEERMELLSRMVRRGDMTVERAAEYAGMTTEQFSSYGK